MTRALAARTWSELRDLLADLPATRLAPQARPPGPPVPSRGRCPGASHRPWSPCWQASGSLPPCWSMRPTAGGLHLAAPARAAHRAAPELLPLHTQALRPKVL